MIKELLIDQLQDLLHAETQLVEALPEMAEAAHHPKLKEAFEKHLSQTQGQVERLQQVFGMLGEKPKAKPCKAMQGLIAEGQETIGEGKDLEPLAADLALIAAAQRVEHYEISAYGTARTMARQLGAKDCARLLSHTLGEEESTDFLLTMISEPLMQQASLDDMGASTDLGATAEIGTSSPQSPSRKKKAVKTARGAA
jgi:Mn-containing catalase